MPPDEPNASPPPPPASPPPPPPPSSAPSFMDSLPEMLRPTAAAKGWKGHDDVAKAYGELHTFLGADKSERGVVLPKDANDAEGWARVWGRLGRPDAPDKYEIKAPEGADPEFLKEFRGWAHGANLLPGGAQQMFDAIHNFGVKFQESEEANRKAQDAIDEAELRREFGGQYDARIELGRRAARQFEVDEAMGAAIEGAIGRKAYAQLMDRIGKGLAESRTPGGGDGDNLTPTPAEAQKAIDELTKDTTFQKRLTIDKDPLARKQWDLLHEQLRA